MKGLTVAFFRVVTPPNVVTVGTVSVVAAFAGVVIAMPLTGNHVDQLFVVGKNAVVNVLIRRQVPGFGVFRGHLEGGVKVHFHQVVGKTVFRVGTFGEDGQIDHAGIAVALGVSVGGLIDAGIKLFNASRILGAIEGESMGIEL